MTTTADRVLDALVEAGVRSIWAVQGGSIAPFLDRAEDREEINVYYCPTEAGAAYAADGACRALGSLVAASAVTTGPGVWGAMPGLLSSVTDGVPVCCVAGLPREGDWFQPMMRLPEWARPWVVRCRIDEWLAESSERILLAPSPTASGSWAHYRAWLDRVLPVPDPRCVDAVRGAYADRPSHWVTADAGLALAYVERTLRPLLGHCLVVPAGQAPMGAAVYMACGIAAATGESVLALPGDGSWQMQRAAAALADRYNLDVHVTVLNSRGYSAIRSYQAAALGARYYGTYGYPEEGRPHDVVEVDW